MSRFSFANGSQNVAMEQVGLNVPDLLCYTSKNTLHKMFQDLINHTQKNPCSKPSVSDPGITVNGLQVDSQLFSHFVDLLDLDNHTPNEIRAAPAIKQHVNKSV